MPQIKQKLKKAALDFWRDESGQGATEYILILVVIGVIVIAFKTPIEKAITKQTGAVGEKIGDFITEIKP